MVFNSIEFLVFFSIVVLGNFLLPLRMRWIWLLAASLFFYGFSEPVFLVQILAATALSFYLALRIDGVADKQVKQRWLTAGIVLLVANLVAFKYASFLNETLRSMLGWMGIGYASPVLTMLLPIGISFYTFLLIAYLVDVFRGMRAERHAGIFTLYVMFFPKLVAGPIERARNLLPQLHARRPFDYQQVTVGLQLMLWGAFKKVVVADRIAPFVQQVYDQPQSHDGVTITVVTWMYAFQIYCDFSGYTDMALGAAAILGFKLMENFNRPYFAVSIQDFWKRWHISLTSWLTDYVYTPFTRQRLIKMKFYNLMLLGLFITFVVSGLWHGAQWTFVAWGALHGLYIVAALQLQKPWNAFARYIGLAERPALHRALKIVFTFNLVCFAYILFRAHSMADAWYMMTHLFTGWHQALYTLETIIMSNSAEFALAVAGIMVVMGVETLKGRIDIGAALAARPRLRWSLYYAGATSIVMLGAFYGLNQSFIYFRF